MLLTLDGLSKFYGPLPALKSVSLEIEPGQTVAILGLNGAGKTTLLRCLVGLAMPTEGRILFDRQPFLREQLDLRRRVGYLADFPTIVPGMTVLNHIGMVLQLYGVHDRPGIEDTVVGLLEEFDLLTVSEMAIGLLSRGQLYKTALAALMAVDPELWLLDEPFASGMDPIGLMALKRRAKEAATRGRILLYTTQIVEIAETFADRVCILHQGQIKAYDMIELLQHRTLDGGGGLGEVLQKLRAQTK